MLIMASVIRVGQSKFVTAPIDEDSTERIMNCIQTLSELESKPPVHQIFLKDTKAAYSKMVAAQEVRPQEIPLQTFSWLTILGYAEKGSRKEGVGESGSCYCPGRRPSVFPSVL